MIELDRPKRKPRARRALIIAIVAIIAIALIGVLSRMHSAHKLGNETRDDATLQVTIVHPKNDPNGADVVLPGTIRAWHEASLSARVPGYLKAWHKDIGEKVKAGDLLAEIETPETDAQLRQAEADLAQAVADSNLAQVTAKRWLALLKTDSVTRQETDQNVANARLKAAAVLSATANRDRLREQENFKNITAPFDGIVTNRATDIGQLISVDGSELYHVATTDDLRVYVNVPENYTGALGDNVTAELHLAEHPGHVYQAKLLSTAGAIDPASRTLLAQFVMDNSKDHLFPGGYAEVHLKGPRAAPSLRLPVNAFLFQSDGLQVAVVGPDHKITLKSVQPGRDFGKEIEIVSGVEANDDIVINPSDSLYTGEQVRIAPAPKQDGGEQGQQAENDKKKNPPEDQSGSKDQESGKGDGKSGDAGASAGQDGQSSGGKSADRQSSGGQSSDQSPGESAPKGPTATPTTPPDNHISGGAGSSVTAAPDENSKAKAGKDDDQASGGKSKSADDKTKKSNDPNSKDDAK